MKRAFVCCLVLAAAGSAVADPDRRWRGEGALGMRLGSFHVGQGFDGWGVGMHVDGGLRRDRWAVLAEYSFLSAQHRELALDPSEAIEPMRALVHRAGVQVRYSVGRISGGGRPRFRGDFWIEGGGGEQWIRWERGGILRRPDVAIGFGGQFSARFGAYPGRRLGIYYAFRGTFARDPDDLSMQPPTCAGPCTVATRPLGIDRSLLFNLGVLFGN